ncbi:MAG: hypothetical protein AAGD04_08965 [Pseudomonadota bacterium]
MEQRFFLALFGVVAASVALFFVVEPMRQSTPADAVQTAQANTLSSPDVETPSVTRQVLGLFQSAVSLSGKKQDTIARIPGREGNEGPEAYLFRDHSEIRATGPIAAVIDEDPIFIDQVFDGFTREQEAFVPVFARFGDLVQNCAPNPSNPSATVQHIMTYQGGAPTRLRGFGSAEFARMVETYYKTAAKGGKIYFGIPRGGGRYDVQHVVVTQTAQPVHLVLMGGHTVLWHIHVAQGTTVSGVDVLGGTAGAVAGLGADVPVAFFPLAQITNDCGLAWPRADDQRAHVSNRVVSTLQTTSVDGSSRAKINRVLEEYPERADGLDIHGWRWKFQPFWQMYTAAFGPDPQGQFPAYTSFDVYVVGPAPTSALPFATLQDTPLVLAPEGHYFDKTGWKTNLKQKIESQAQALIGSTTNGVEQE